MSDIREQKAAFLERVQEYNHKYELSKIVGPDYYEPGMMENLEQYRGFSDDFENYAIRVDVKGLRYENRSAKLKKCKVGDELKIIRDTQNSYNANNFNVSLSDGFIMGTLPANLCDAIASLYDLGFLVVDKAFISYIEQLNERSRYAKQGVMFVEMHVHLSGL